MASSNEEQVKKVPHMAQGEKSKSKNNSAVSKSKCLILAIAFIVAIGALGTAAYTLFLNKQLQNQLSKENTNFSTQLKELEQKQDQAQEQIKAQTNYAEEIQTKFERLSKQLQSAMSQRFYQNQDWLLLKARYYLQLAQINAHWSNGSDSTIALLEQADQLLKQSNDAKIFNIRQAIAKDIAQIQAIPSVDIAGLLSQLDAVQNSINDLSIPLPVSANNPTTENTTSPTSNSSGWRLHMQDSINVLEKLVVIRHHDQNMKPLMSPLFEAIVKENLHLNLQEAQWAVLNNDPFVYQMVLKQAIKNLKTYFNEKTPNTAAFIKKLAELQQMNVTPKRPAIGSALPMLNELIDAKKNVNQSISSEQGGNQ